MARRRCVVPVEPKVDPTCESRVHRCQSCGVGLHGTARRQSICSYCKGDPFHGTDGYLLGMIQELLDNPHCPEPRKAELRLLLQPKISDDPLRLRKVYGAVGGEAQE